MYPLACRSSPQHDSPSFVEGFAFALLDAQLVKEKPNGSLASAVDSRARAGSPCSVQKNQLGRGVDMRPKTSWDPFFIHSVWSLHTRVSFRGRKCEFRIRQIWTQNPNSVTHELWNLRNSLKPSWPVFLSMLNGIGNNLFIDS